MRHYRLSFEVDHFLFPDRAVRQESGGLRLLRRHAKLERATRNAELRSAPCRQAPDFRVPCCTFRVRYALWHLLCAASKWTRLPGSGTTTSKLPGAPKELWISAPGPMARAE